MAIDTTFLVVYNGVCNFDMNTYLDQVIWPDLGLKIEILLANPRVLDTPCWKQTVGEFPELCRFIKHVEARSGLETALKFQLRLWVSMNHDFGGANNPVTTALCQICLPVDLDCLEDPVKYVDPVQHWLAILDSIVEANVIHGSGLLDP